MKHIDGKEFIKLVRRKASHDDLKFRFDLTQPQLDQVFGKVMASGHLTYEEIYGIPQLDGLKKSKIRDICYGYICEKDFDGAKKIVEYIKSHFPDLKGFKSVISNLDGAIEYDRRERNYLSFMESYQSPALNRLKAEYPFRFESLHPEIIRHVKHLETCEYVKEWETSIMKSLVATGNAKARLDRLAPYYRIMPNLSDLQASRLWHLIGLKIFCEEDVPAFIVHQYDKHLYCGDDSPCLWISCKTFSTEVGRRIVDKHLDKIATSKVSMATIEIVDNMSPEQSKKNLIKKSCFLPPFCEGCTCQIFAYHFDW